MELKFIALIPTAHPETKVDAYMALTSDGRIFLGTWRTPGAPDEFHLHWTEQCKPEDSPCECED